MQLPPSNANRDREKKIKCLVWDLDNTLWHGILAEGDAISVRPQVREIIAELDSRGILFSIASRNDTDAAWLAVKSFGLDSYFLHPQIGWNDKSSAVRKIATALDLSLDTFAFVDDQPFERDEVAFHLPQVRTYDIADLPTAIASPAFTPPFVTEDARNRRKMYIAEETRDADLAQFDGPRDAFLKTLDMQVIIRRARKEDLQRVEELTQRTSQLNTTGRIYTQAQLATLVQCPDHLMFVVSLSDRYGPSGLVGLVLLEVMQGGWMIRLLVMSCRVINRGIGGIVLSHVLAAMKAQRLRIAAEYIPTDRNRLIYMTYRFHGFQELGVNGEHDVIELTHDLDTLPTPPQYAAVTAPDLQLLSRSK